MKRFGIILIAVLLSGCDDTNPFTTAADGDSTTGVIPDAIKGDLSKFTYNPTNGTLTVEGLTLDEVPFAANYRRRPAMDVPGYQAYTAQDDPLDRHTTAFVAQTGNGGAVRAGVVVTGGLFNRYFGGGYYERDGNFTPPTVTSTSGLVTYAGTYAGLTNIGGDGGDLLTVPAGTDSSLIPRDSGEVIGTVELNVDFADNSLEGSIYDRSAPDSNLALPTIILVATTIASDGTFIGTTVEYENNLDIDIGDYGGIFGGPNAEGVGGIVRLTEFDGDGNPLGFENEEEYGVFVLNQCGTPDEAAAPCASVNP